MAVDTNDDPHVIWSECVFNAGMGTCSIRYNNKIGGTWNSSVSVNAVTGNRFSGADIMIGDPLSAVCADRPIVASSRDICGLFGSLDVSYGNALNATSFIEEADITDTFGCGVSLHGCGFNGNDISAAIDSNKKITIAFVEHTTQDLMVIEHLHADAWTTWQTEVDVDISTNYEFPSIAIDGTDRYIFVKDDTNSDINLWRDLGVGWAEETANCLPNVGTFDFPLSKWASKNNNTPSSIDYVFSDATGVLYNTFPKIIPPPPATAKFISSADTTNAINTSDPSNTICNVEIPNALNTSDSSKTISRKDTTKSINRVA